MHTEGSVEIDRSIEDVFEYTNHNVAEWSIIVTEEEVIEQQPGEVGSTFRTVTEEHGRRMEFEGVVTDYEPPHLSGVHMAGQMFDLDVVYQFEAIDHQRTRVTQKSDVTGKGFLKVVFWLGGWLMKKASCDALQKELESLKQHAEAWQGSAK